MKNKLAHLFQPTQEEFKSLWTNATFVFDTNILLHTYRYSPGLKEELFNILKKLKGRLWMPHQVAKEYLTNRPQVILEQEAAYESLKENINKSITSLASDLDTYRRHSRIDAQKILHKISTAATEALSELKQLGQSHPNLLENDENLRTLDEIFESCTGDEFPQNELLKIYSEGKERYERQAPPGYKDANAKKGVEQYGDLIIWKQIITYTTTHKKDIIFVSDDLKEDWIWEVKGRKLGPRPELLEEFHQKTGQTIYIYNFPQFLKQAPLHLGLGSQSSNIEEAKQVMEEVQQEVSAVNDQAPIKPSLPIVIRLRAWASITGRTALLNKFLESPLGSPNRKKFLDALSTHGGTLNSELWASGILSKEEQDYLTAMRALKDLATTKKAPIKAPMPLPLRFRYKTIK